MHKLLTFISCLWYFFVGKIISYFVYDKKYLKGRWFKGKYKSFGSIGWRWVVKDTFYNFFHGNGLRSKYPIGKNCYVVNSENILFDPNDLNNFHGFGNYYQAIGKIVIGRGTYIAPNVGLITSNHDLHDLDNHLEPQDIIIGKKCWIGMNSTILPGVVLGDSTIVGAGSVVTKSFEEGNCVIAGNPAQLIRSINKES